MNQHELKAGDQLRRASEFGHRSSDRVAFGRNCEARSAVPLPGSRAKTIPRLFLDGSQSRWNERVNIDFTRPYTRSLALDHVADYLQLMRPRLALMVLATAAVGWLLAAGDASDWTALGHSLLAIGMLFAGASALNQLLERDTDALMPRTANRPLPAGRLQPLEVLILGCGLSAGGVGYLLASGQPLAAGLGAFALLSYVFVYTPLKTRTPLNTLIGAIPGALPPLMGWATARGELDSGALALFLIVLLWQIPHFLAIAWIYHDQYARAGLRMFPLFDPGGVRTGRQMVWYTLVLIPTSLLPFAMGISGWIFAFGAAILGLAFLRAGLAYSRNPSTPHARQVLRTSLVYLGGLLLLFALDAMVRRGM
jgi:protoheme IX farnesyltransferase